MSLLEDQGVATFVRGGYVGDQDASAVVDGYRWKCTVRVCSQCY
jgi:hypothetical protein